MAKNNRKRKHGWALYIVYIVTPQYLTIFKWNVLCSNILYLNFVFCFQMAINLKRQAILDYEEATAKHSLALSNVDAANAEFQKVRFFQHIFRNNVLMH